MKAQKKTVTKRRYSQALSEQSSPYVRVLSVGYSKTGKTHFALTFPNPVIANADAGLATDIPANCKVDPCVFNFIRWNDDLKEDELWSWTDLMQLVRELKYRKGSLWDEAKSYGYEPETLIIDSGTTFCDLFAYEITKEPTHAEKDTGKHMETLQIGDYNLVGQRMYNILDMMKTLPMHVVMTAEMDDIQDKDMRRYQQPAMIGRALGKRLPHYFDEVYIHYTQIEKDNTHFYLIPQQTRDFEHSGSRKGIPLQPHENPSFAKLAKYYVRKKT